MDLSSIFTRAPVAPADLAPNLWMIIALPLLGAFICGVFGRMLGRANTYLVACSAVAGSFIMSLLAFWATSDVQVLETGAKMVAAIPSAFSGAEIRYAVGFDLGTWFSAGDFRVNFGFMVDHLSGTLLLVITGVGFLIHLYSTSYMSHDDVIPA